MVHTATGRDQAGQVNARRRMHETVVAHRKKQMPVPRTQASAKKRKSEKRKMKCRAGRWD